MPVVKTPPLVRASARPSRSIGQSVSRTFGEAVPLQYVTGLGNLAWISWSPSLVSDPANGSQTVSRTTALPNRLEAFRGPHHHSLYQSGQILAVTVGLSGRCESVLCGSALNRI